MFLYFILADWQPVQSVPYLLPCGSMDRLQHSHDCDFDFCLQIVNVDY